MSAAAQPLILASASPRRREILSTLGIALEVQPSDVDESALRFDDDVDFVREAALSKLARVLEKHAGNKGIVGRLRRGRFAMLLNNCDVEDGRSIVDRQRRSMEKSRCVWHGDSFQLTAGPLTS